MQSASDQILLQRSLAGDFESYGELIKRYHKAVFNVCYRITGNIQEAEDLSQEAFIRANKFLKAFDQEKPFGPWIKKIATNLCLNEIKKNKNNLYRYGDKEEISYNTNPEKEFSKRENLEIIHQAILSLSPNQRAVIELRHYQDLSYKEISKTLKMPISDVKSHLFRGRKKLAKKLKDYE